MSQPESNQKQVAGSQDDVDRDLDRDVISILLDQHVRIRGMFDAMQAASGRERQALFDGLRELLAIHEVGEEMVLRPYSRKVAGVDIADERNREEGEAAYVMAELEGLDVHSERFAALFTEFEKAVSEHADLEEIEEFPALRTALTAEELRELGDRLLRAEQRIPLSAEATATATTTTATTFAALLDGARDMYMG